jgi:hypothetical protein
MTCSGRRWTRTWKGFLKCRWQTAVYINHIKTSIISSELLLCFVANRRSQTPDARTAREFHGVRLVTPGSSGQTQDNPDARDMVLALALAGALLLLHLGTADGQFFQTGQLRDFTGANT